MLYVKKQIYGSCGNYIIIQTNENKKQVQKPFDYKAEVFLLEAEKLLVLWVDPYFL